MTARPSRRRIAHDPRIQFLRGFLRRPREVGSIIPSSRFLERRVVRAARADRVRLAVELGPGTGGTTRALLRALPPGATLLAIEINAHFGRMLRAEIDDPRLVVHEGSAAEIAAALAAHGLGTPDLIVSGIPFSTMEPDEGLAILRSAHAVLAPRGRFVAYQVRDRVKTLGRRVFGAASVQMELLNVPPMRVYCWDKPVAPSAAAAHLAPR